MFLVMGKHVWRICRCQKLANGLLGVCTLNLLQYLTPGWVLLEQLQVSVNMYLHVIPIYDDYL